MTIISAIKVINIVKIHNERKTTFKDTVLSFMMSMILVTYIIYFEQFRKIVCRKIFSVYI